VSWKRRLVVLGRLPLVRGWREQGALMRAVLLLVLCSVAALLMMDHVRVPEQEFTVGDVAPYDLLAPVSFSYIDWDHTAEQKREARELVPPVFEMDATLGARLQNRVSLSFDAARRKLQAITQSTDPEEQDQESAEAVEPTPEQLDTIAAEFLTTLELAVDDDHLQTLLRTGFDSKVEALVNEFIGVTMRRLVVTDRGLIPSDARAISVYRITSDGRREVLLDRFDDVVTVEDARQDLALYVLEHDPTDHGAEAERAAAAIARASVRPNVTSRPDITERRRNNAINEVAPVEIQVKQGTVLFRAGDVLSQRHVEMLAGLNEVKGSSNTLALALSLLAFCVIVISTFYLYGSNYIRHFGLRMRDLQAMAFLLLLVLGLSRLVLEIGAGVTQGPAGGPLQGSIWYIVPVAGGAMLVRILANGETALIFAIVASLLCGVMMEQQVFYTLFFLISSVAAAGGVAHAKERAHVLRAGLQTAVVNGAVVLLIDLLSLHQGSAATMGFGTLAWDMLFAVSGGIIGAMMVLGLIPLFEMFGFVTEYKMLELANLNHPLLRQLMLRAPGTYHHSVIVGSLSEAAAEAIGADKLLVRVAAYFHDIGKITKPHYFVENQRDVPNPHDRLPARKSASIIIRHIEAGARIAAHNRLPQPIIDNICMHHGTGLVRWFYNKAQQEAQPGQVVDEADYRYPGPRPDTREAGILHLADKVEAACRAVKQPTPEKFREVIQNLISQAMNDGQLEDCSLTLKELYTIGKSFAEVMMSIYHHRIEYPSTVVDTQDDEPGPEVPQRGVITLELLNPLGDEQAVEVLPPSDEEDLIPEDWEDESSQAIPVEQGVGAAKGSEE
jgi:putative nucleotidyltransferase with HDIG domain